jgi:hypothetical protein
MIKVAVIAYSDFCCGENMFKIQDFRDPKFISSFLKSLED